MPPSIPSNCANPECRDPSVRPIHCSSQKVAIDAVDGAPVFSHSITYRCAQCGHTWAVTGYSAERTVWPLKDVGVPVRGARTSSRGW